MCLRCGHRWLTDFYSFEESYVCPRCEATPKTYQPDGARVNDGEKVTVLRPSFLERFVLPQTPTQRECLTQRAAIKAEKEARLQAA